MSSQPPADPGDSPTVGSGTPPAPLFDMLDLDTVSDEADPDVAVTRAGRTVTGTVAVDADVDLERLCEVALTVLTVEEAPPGRLDLHLVDVDTIRELNATHMFSDEPTDVLAFPLDPEDDIGIGDTEPLLGDVVICPTVAFEQAPGHTGSFSAEMILLAVHGTLHVLGHDHAETDERLRMQARERHHLDRLDLAHPVPAP